MEGMGSVTHSCSALLPAWPIPTCRMATWDQRQKLIHGSSTETKVLNKCEMLSWWLNTKNRQIQLKEDILSVTSSSLLPLRDQYKTRGKNNIRGKKNPHTSDKSWYGKNYEDGLTLEAGITYFPGNWEVMRTCYRYQHLPVDTQITMARTSWPGVKMKTCSAIPVFNNIFNRFTFLPEEFVDGDEETWARIDFQT